MDRAEALGLVKQARVGRLATIGPSGAPHIVPITYALVAGEVAHMVDHKPKTTLDLVRLRNITRDPRASLLVDHYIEDWRALWWVRIDGLARIVADEPGMAGARSALGDKYPQYREEVPEGPAVFLAGETVRWWAAAG